MVEKFEPALREAPTFHRVNWISTNVCKQRDKMYLTLDRSTRSSYNKNGGIADENWGRSWWLIDIEVETRKRQVIQPTKEKQHDLLNRSYTETKN